MNKIHHEKILFIDIETVPLVYKYSDLQEETMQLWNRKWIYNRDIDPQEQYVKAGIYAEFAKVACIGFGFYSGGKFSLGSFSGSDEKKVLEDFCALLNTSFGTDQHLLCAHNGKEFDFPFLCRRLIINSVPLPRALRLQGLKPWNINHIDTMELWKFGDIKNYSSLALLANILEIPSPKDDMDGSMVSKVFYEDNDVDRISLYCKKDVLTMTRVYNRFCGAAGPADDEIIFA